MGRSVESKDANFDDVHVRVTYHPPTESLYEFEGHRAVGRGAGSVSGSRWSPQHYSMQYGPQC